MEGSPESLRHELKAVCQESAYPLLRSHLEMHPSAPRELYPPRRVQSVYLDTPDNQALRKNLAGISHREKLRVRWYGEEARGVRAVLERKVRQAAMGWKDLAPLEVPLDVEGVDRLTFMRELRAAVPEAWAVELGSDGLEPVKWISYDREYIATADGRVRITLDRGLRATDLRGRFVLTHRLPSHLPRVLIAEAKCDAGAHDEAMALLQGLPLHVDRCSKFVLASLPEHGAIASLLPD
jgi:hypothetical protein